MSLGRKVQRFQPETLAYFTAHPELTPAEIAALDLEIKGIKSGTPLTLSSLTCNLSLISGAYFITRASTDLNRYSGISGVQYSVAATGTPATTAVYSGAITAGTGETLAEVLNSNPTFDVNTTGWSAGDSGLSSVAGGYSNNCLQVDRTGGALQYASQGILSTVGKLERLSAYIKSGTSGNETYKIYAADIGGGSYGSPKITGTSSASWVNGIGYFTASAVAGTIYTVKDSGTAGTMLFDEVYVQQVLTPDATGIIAAALTAGAINTAAATYVVTVSKP